MDWSLKIGDLAIVVATLAGPVLAVQAQKWIERGRQVRERRVTIFRVLMATRAAMLSPGHVEALNAIPVEFYGKDPKLKLIKEAWKAYFDHLSQPITDHNFWAEKRMSLFNDLLFSISQILGYDFTKLELKREIYAPTGHAQMASDQDMIRQGIAKLLRGEISLPMDVKSFPANPEFLQNQTDIQKGLLSWLAGDRSVKVSFDKSDGPAA